jgi:hypothetical protein
VLIGFIGMYATGTLWRDDLDAAGSGGGAGSGSGARRGGDDDDDDDDDDAEEEEEEEEEAARGGGRPWALRRGDEEAGVRAAAACMRARGGILRTCFCC